MSSAVGIRRTPSSAQSAVIRGLKDRLTRSPVETPENPSHMSQRFVDPESVNAQLSSLRDRAPVCHRVLRLDVQAAQTHRSTPRHLPFSRNRTICCVAEGRANPPLQMLQARNVSVKRSKQFDQLGKTHRNSLSALRFKTVSALTAIQ